VVLKRTWLNPLLVESKRARENNIKREETTTAPIPATSRMFSDSEINLISDLVSFHTNRTMGLSADASEDDMIREVKTFVNMLHNCYKAHPLFAEEKSDDPEFIANRHVFLILEFKDAWAEYQTIIDDCEQFLIQRGICADPR